MPRMLRSGASYDRVNFYPRRYHPNYYCTYSNAIDFKHILLYVDQQNISWSMQLFMLEVLQYHPKGSPSYDEMYQTSYTDEVILK